MVRKIVGYTALVVMYMCQTSAQETLSVRVTGRALFDAAAYSQNGISAARVGKMNPGVAMRDVRLGFVAKRGKWTMRGDASLVGNRVSLKDTYLQYAFEKNNLLRFGHYTIPFALSSAFTSIKKEFLNEPEAEIFQPDRYIGLMHTVYSTPLWLQYGLFADRSALTQSTDKSGEQGYTASGRLVWRPFMEPNKGIHLGVSGMYVRAESHTKEHNHIFYSKGFLSSVDKRRAIGIDVTDARWEGKYAAELQMLYHHLQLSWQGYLSVIHREDKKDPYHTCGMYLSARGILINPQDYEYDMANAGIEFPKDKNLEWSLGYGLIDLRDRTAYENSFIEGFAEGGRRQNLSFGLSLFWNQNVTFRTGYHYVMVDRYDSEREAVNVFECRLQYIF